MEEIFIQEPPYLGFCKDSGIGVGGIWINHTKSGTKSVWCHPWTSGITNELVLDTNKGGTLTNSNLEVAYLVPHGDTLL